MHRKCILLLFVITATAKVTSAEIHKHPFVGTNGMVFEELETLRLPTDIDSGRIQCQIYALAIEALAPTSREGDASAFLDLNKGLFERTNAEFIASTVEDFLLAFIDRCVDSYADIISSAVPLLCRALQIVKLKYRILAPTNFGSAQFGRLNSKVQKFDRNVIQRQAGRPCPVNETIPMLANINPRNSASLFTVKSDSDEQLATVTCKASLLALEALMPERGNPMDFVDLNNGLVQTGRAELLNTIEDILSIYAAPACERTQRETTPLAGAILCKALINVSLKQKLIALAIQRNLINNDEEFSVKRQQKLDRFKDIEQQLSIRCSPENQLLLN